MFDRIVEQPKKANFIDKPALMCRFGSLEPSKFQAPRL